MSIKICVKCSNAMPNAARFCNQCRGTSFRKSAPCPGCKTPLPRSDSNFCPSCGKRLTSKPKIKMKQVLARNGEKHKCNICMQIIEYDQVVCPSCLNTYHFNHLANWIISNSSCPTCKVELELVE